MVGPDAQPAQQNSLCHKQIGERLEATAMIILSVIVIEQFPLVGVDHFTVVRASLRVRRGLDANLITNIGKAPRLTKHQWLSDRDSRRHQLSEPGGKW